MSAGKDAAVRLWQVSPEAKLGRAGKPQAAALTLRQVAVCVGHTDTVAALAVDASGTTAASGGWDGKLLLWSAGGGGGAADGDGDDDGPASAEEAQQGKKKKRQRVGGENGSGAAAAVAAVEQQPLQSLEGHVHCVSALCYAPSNGGGDLQQHLVSGGWDHSVRVWDVGAGRLVATHNGSKAVYAVAAAPLAAAAAGGLVAFAGAEGAVRIWDTRAQGEALAVKGYVTPGSTGSWVAALAWRPSLPLGDRSGKGGGSSSSSGGSSGSEYHIASASHDGTVRLWDLRTPVPLATMTQHSDKALALCWWGSNTLASGGADCKVQLYEMPE
jgi:ribosome biogenesis protein YTM1